MGGPLGFLLRVVGDLRTRLPFDLGILVGRCPGRERVGTGHYQDTFMPLRFTQMWFMAVSRSIEYPT